MSSEWKFVTLSEISTSIGDGLHGTPVYDDCGEYFFINGNNLCDGEIIITDKTRKASRDEYEKHKKNIGDRTILVSINGTIGNIAFYKGENVFLGKSACYINLKESVDKYFVRYVLASRLFQDYISNLATGSTIKNVSLKLMRDFSFKLPPYDIQVSSASSLRAIDDKIKLNRQINQTLEQMAQAIFQSWFVDFEPVKAKIAAREDWLARQAAQSDAHDDAPQFSSPVCYAHEFADAAASAPATQADLETFMNRAAMCAISGKTDADLDAMPAADYQRLYHTASLFPDELIESELGEIPKGWEVGNIGNVAKAKGGFAFKSSEFKECGGAVVKIKNINGDGTVNLNDTDFIAEPVDARVLKFKLADGDLLMAMTGATVGKVGLVVNSGFNAYLNQRVAKFESEKFGRKISFFLYPLLSRSENFDQVVGMAIGSAQPNISSGGIESVKLVVPSDSAIQEYIQTVNPIFSYWIENYRSCQGLSAIRDSLLPKLLSGELDISALTDLAAASDAATEAAHV